MCVGVCVVEDIQNPGENCAVVAHLLVKVTSKPIYAQGKVRSRQLHVYMYDNRAKGGRGLGNIHWEEILVRCMGSNVLIIKRRYDDRKTDEW